MYRNYINARNPTAFWILDDAVPFVEHSGFGASGGKKSGTADPTTAVPLVAGAAFSSVFKSTSVGQFACNLFKQGLENRPFALEAWILPIPKTSTGVQQILSHDTVYDGLTIDGKVIRFGTSYLSFGTAYCDYDLVEYQLAHVVGVHSPDENQLWVNGELVSSIEITEDQKGDTYIATDGNLYSGLTTSTQELAMNGVAFYPSLSGDQIRQNYEAGIANIGQERIASQYGGVPFGLDAANGAVFFEQTWIDKDDFSEGYKQNVEYAPDQIEPVWSAGLSTVGSWTVGVPLDIQGDTSIYGVMVAWSGKNVTVQTSLDGTTWTTATSGSLIAAITSGYNPTDKDLQVKVSFAAGVAQDQAYLESLTVIGFRNNTIDNISARAVTASWPAVLRRDYEPNLYRDDNGINLKGGTLTIGTDTSADGDIARTLELWIKPISGTPTISVSGTKYRNGAVDSTLPVGQWSVIHYVAAADIVTSITVTGDCIVGQAVLYPTALSATEVAHIFKSYTGATAIRISDTAGGTTISEGATPTNIYTHDWSIDSAG